MKHKNFRSAVITRELPPRMQKTPKGIQMICPFCVPSHSLVPGQESVCGTIVKVTAVQTIIPQRTVSDRGLHCLKCGEGRGKMVRFGAGFVHIEDCKPGTKLLAVPPPHSKFAERVFKMKDRRVKNWLEKRYGKAQSVGEVDGDGNETGKVLSYFFLKV